MAVLRGDQGCPWDIRQTPVSLKKYLLEECYELAEAIDNKQCEAICEEIGAGRVGIRLSPLTTFGGGTALDSNPQALYGYVVAQMARLGLAYVHMIEGETGGPREPEGVSFDYAALRRSFPGAWIVNNGGYVRARVIRCDPAGYADARNGRGRGGGGDPGARTAA